GGIGSLPARRSVPADQVHRRGGAARSEQQGDRVYTLPSGALRIARWRKGMRGHLMTAERENASAARGSFAAAKEGWLKLIASHPDLSSADLAFAIMLSTYMNFKSRDAWPSVRRLAADTNRNPGTVWRSLRRLEGRKLIFVIHGRGPRNPNRYRPGLGELG